MGSDNNYETAGGGGSFVTTENNLPLIIAGAGGGVYKVSSIHRACHGSVSTNGNPGDLDRSRLPGGTNGTGGETAEEGGGGGGEFKINCDYRTTQKTRFSLFFTLNCKCVWATCGFLMTCPIVSAILGKQRDIHYFE